MDQEPEEQTVGPDAEAPGAVSHDHPDVSAADTTARGPSVFESVWMVVACLLLAASAILLWRSHPDAAFVTAALGVSAWFLNVRTNLKRKHGLKRRGRRNWTAGDDQDWSDED